MATGWLWCRPPVVSLPASLHRERGRLAPGVGRLVQLAGQEGAVRVAPPLLQQIGDAVLHRRLGLAVQLVAPRAVLEKGAGVRASVWGAISGCTPHVQVQSSSNRELPLRTTRLLLGQAMSQHGCEQRHAEAVDG